MSAESDLSPPRIKQEFSYLMGEKQTASHRNGQNFTTALFLKCNPGIDRPPVQDIHGSRPMTAGIDHSSPLATLNWISVRRWMHCCARKEKSRCFFPKILFITDFLLHQNLNYEEKGPLSSSDV